MSTTRLDPIRGLLLSSLLLCAGTPVAAQVNPSEAVVPGQPRLIEMTLETMTQLALSDGYRVRFLNMNIEQTAWELRAERARLRSSVDFEFSAPVWSDISQEHFNPDLGRTELFRENELRVEGELSIRQPVILFGFPTNGYLSLNNRVYRLAQRESDGERDVEYYNRYFIQYTQPLFQPNELKNSLEVAELDLESEEIDYYENVLDLVDDISEDYFSLFETAYNVQVTGGYVVDLEEAVAAAQAVVQNDPTRSIELDQIRVELANAEEQLGQSQADLRRQFSNLRTELNIAATDSIVIDPTIDVVPIQIDADRAVQFAQELAPRLRRLRIQEREREIDLDEVEGRNAFQVDLEFTYGREMRNPYFDHILQDPENTYTVDVNASVPLWDWGERDARIEASRVDLRRSALQMEEANVEIVADVQNGIQDVLELQDRAVSMDENLALAEGISEQSLARYREGSMTALDLLQTLQRELETAENLLEAYVGWRESIQGLQELTYYDFELDVPVMQRYGIDVASVAGLDQG
jgi:outer membrane protein TolC